MHALLVLVLLPMTRWCPCYVLPGQYVDKTVVQRAAARRENFWVVKVAQGARSADVFVSSSAKAVMCHRAAPGDRVAQASIHRPVLFQGRQVDMRVCRRLQRSVSWHTVSRMHCATF